MKIFFKKLTIVFLFLLVGNLVSASDAKNTKRQDAKYAAQYDSAEPDPSIVIFIAAPNSNKLANDVELTPFEAAKTGSLTKEDKDFDWINIFDLGIIDWIKEVLGL